MELLKSYSFNPLLIEILKKVIEINLKDRNNSTKKQFEVMEKKLIELKSRRKLIVEKSIRNVITDEDTKELLYENEQQTKQIMREKQHEGINIIDASKVVNYGLQILEDIRGTWEKADLQTKKRLQNFLFPKGLPFDGKEFGTTSLPLCIQMQQDWNLRNNNLVGPRGIEPLSEG